LAYTIAMPKASILAMEAFQINPIWPPNLRWPPKDYLYVDKIYEAVYVKI